MTIHIAGFPVRIGTRGRQLCAWCGRQLFDVDHANEMVPLNADGTPGEGSRPWEPNALIEIRRERDGEGNYSAVVPHVDGESLPDDSCFDLEFPRPRKLQLVKP